MIVELIRAIPLLRIDTLTNSPPVIIPAGTRGELLKIDEKNAAFAHVRLMEYGTTLRLAIGYHIRQPSALEILADAANEDTP